MSIARIAQFVTMARPVAMARFAPAQARGMAGDRMSEKESSIEKDFVTRQERDALKQMLAKLEATADPGNKKAFAALEEKLAKNNIKLDSQLKADLLAWKNTAH